MKTITKYGILLLGLVPMLTLGAAPTGSFTYNVSDQPLYDFSGPHHVELPITGGTLVLDFALDHQPNGEVVGEGIFSLTHNSGTASGSVALRGNSHQSDDSSRRGRGRGGDDSFDSNEDAVFLTVGLKLTGTGDFGAGSTKVTGNLTSQLTRNPETGELTGPVRGRINARKAKGIKISDTLTLATGATGNWDLTLNITGGDSNDLTGTATFTSNSGQLVEFDLEGDYNPNTDVTTFDLTPVEDEPSRSSIRLTTLGELAELTGLDARIFGQRQRLGELGDDSGKRGRNNEPTENENNGNNGNNDSRGRGRGRN